MKIFWNIGSTIMIGFAAYSSWKDNMPLATYYAVFAFYFDWLAEKEK